MSWLTLILGGALATVIQELRLWRKKAKIEALMAEVKDVRREHRTVQRLLDTATVELEQAHRTSDRRAVQARKERDFLQRLLDGVEDSPAGRNLLRKRFDRISLPLAGADDTRPTGPGDD